LSTGATVTPQLQLGRVGGDTIALRVPRFPTDCQLGGLDMSLEVRDKNFVDSCFDPLIAALIGFGFA